MYRTFFSVAAAAALAVATASISTASAATSDELTASMQAELQDATPAWKPEAAVYFVELTPDKKPTTNSQYGGALAVDAKGKMTCLVRARGGVVNEELHFKGAFPFFDAYGNNDYTLLLTRAPLVIVDGVPYYWAIGRRTGSAFEPLGCLSKGK